MNYRPTTAKYFKEGDNIFMDRVKKLKVKKQDGTFTDYIPIAVDARYVDLDDGSDLQTTLDNVYSDIDDTIDNKVNAKVGDIDTKISGAITDALDENGAITTKINSSIDEAITDVNGAIGTAIATAIEDCVFMDENGNVNIPGNLNVTGDISAANFTGGGGGGTGGGIPIGTVSNITATASDESATVKWTDPDDIVIQGYTLATWAGTKLVIKAGSYPTSAGDGMVKVDSKVRNQYQTNGFVITGLENDTVYYGALFPYSEEGSINKSESNRFTVEPGAVYPSAATNITISKDSNALTMTCNFTIPSDATKATVVMKQGSIPANSGDGSVVSNLTTGNATFSGIVKDQEYYFRVFTYNAKNRETPAEAVMGKIASLETVTFSAGTDEQIAAMLNAHYNNEIDISEYWAVGNTRKIHLNSVANPRGSGTAWAAQNITIVITAMNHHDLATPINGHTKAAITCQTRECINNDSVAYNQNGHIYPMLTSQALNNDQAWAGSTQIGLRTWGNGAFYSTMLPEGTRNMIKEITRQVLTTHTGTGLAAATDKVFLPTEYEIFGTKTYTNAIEGTQWKYYETSSNRIKYGNNGGNPNSTAQYWWNGSPNRDTDRWGCVSTGGRADYNNGTNAHGFAPAFAM